MTAPRPPLACEPPEGFTPSTLDEGFLNQIGPLYQSQAEDGHHVIAFRATVRHLNLFKAVHGGMLATLADVAVGTNIARAGACFEPSVTLTLSLDYIDAAHVGEWIEAHTALRKRAGRVRFGDCDILADGRLVARAHATFYVRKPPA